MRGDVTNIQPAPRPIPNYGMRRQTGMPWIDCFICGFSIPQHESVRHYRKQKLVCLQCNDALTQADHYELQLPTDPQENTRRSEQPVQNQGQQP